MIEHHHRHNFQPEFLRRSQPPVTGDDHTVATGEDRVGESELGNRRGDLRHLIVRVSTRVAGIGQQLGSRPSKSA